jgi:phenylacetate-CoA ligase
MNVIKPNVVQCYPSMLNLLSQEFKKNHLKFKLKLIFTTAELLLPTWRKNISDFFDCDVIDLYGTSEFHRLAWECEKHEGYHLDIDAHVIEFLDNNNKPVEQGEGNIIITSLFNYVFPFIRYRIGDIAKLRKSKCTCDRSLPVINSIQGRDDDYIKLPSGKTVSPRKINVLDKLKGVKEYNIIQYKEDFIKVKIVKNDDFTENTIESIKTQILKGCQEDNIKIEIELVKEIERNSGKIRTVTSLIKKMIS